MVFPTCRGPVIVPTLVVAAGIANYHHLWVREYTVDVPRRSSSEKGGRICLLANPFEDDLIQDFMKSLGRAR